MSGKAKPRVRMKKRMVPLQPPSMVLLVGSEQHAEVGVGDEPAVVADQARQAGKPLATSFEVV